MPKRADLSDLQLRPTEQVEERVQATGWTCGPASLRAVLAFYGVDATEEEIGEKAATDTNGTNNEGLVAAARAFGFEAEAFEDAEFEQLVDLVGRQGIPVIVGWYTTDGGVDGHYSVVKRADDMHVLLMDPQMGDREMPSEDFRSLWFSFDDTDEVRGLHRHEMVVVYPSGREAVK